MSFSPLAGGLRSVLIRLASLKRTGAQKRMGGKGLLLLQVINSWNAAGAFV